MSPISSIAIKVSKFQRLAIIGLVAVCSFQSVLLSRKNIRYKVGRETGEALLSLRIDGNNSTQTSHAMPEIHHYENTIIPLADLIDNGETIDCPNGTAPVTSRLLPEEVTHANRKIPRIIHVTSKYACATSAFQKNFERWKKFENHSFILHDDGAVDRLFLNNLEEFPHLNLARQCSVSGAAKADLWRYLVLYQYGGIYSDMDSAPGQYFNATTIQPDDDAYVIPEGKGFLAQYFMAMSPRHPLMYLTIQATLERLLSVTNVLNQYVPFVTGPGALKQGGILFRKDEKFGQPRHGVYAGVGNRTVRVDGSPKTTNSYIVRFKIPAKKKHLGYAAINQTYFDVFARRAKEEEKKLLNQSCLNVLYELHSTKKGRSY